MPPALKKTTKNESPVTFQQGLCRLFLLLSWVVVNIGWQSPSIEGAWFWCPPDIAYKAVRTILRDFSLSRRFGYSKTQFPRLRRSGCARTLVTAKPWLGPFGHHRLMCLIRIGGRTVNRLRDWRSNGKSGRSASGRNSLKKAP
jgi:hypothetical protein